MWKPRRDPLRLSVVAALVALAIFLVDISLPLGVAGGVPYVALVLVGWWFAGRNVICILAAVSSALAVLGYFLSPPGGEGWVPTANLFLSLFAIWVTAVLVANAKTSERMLRASEGRLYGVIDIAPEAIILVDQNYRIQLFNEGAAKLFGYCYSEVLGHPVDMLMPAAFREQHRRMVEDFAKGDEVRRLMSGRNEIRGIKKDGTEFPAQASVGKLQFEGRTTFIVILHDITDRKAAEQMLEERAESLARSNAELERFATVASHDLQEPLRMVASYTQLLAKRYKGKLDADADEFIAFAVDGATRMQALINDLLAYSRVNSRGEELTPTDCDKALQSARADLRASIAENGANVVAGPLPTVLGDQAQMSQLFQNLIGNAIKYRSEAPPEIEISADRENGHWHFAVRDNGIGIDPQYSDQIFEIFRRLHTQAERSGTGIGLAICKKIVERHHGQIWVTSRPGAGSTFHFTIPAHEGTADEPKELQKACRDLVG